MIRQLTRALLVVQLAAAAWLSRVLAEQLPGHSLWLAILLALLVLALVRMSIIASGFLLSRRHASPLPSSCQLNPAQGARTFLREYGASMLCWNWCMPFARVGQWIAPAPPTLPVLLVHGYGGNGGYWQVLSRRLKSAGISYRALDLEPAFGPIDGYASLIGSEIDALCAASGSSRVLILAHSMGGLAARAYLRARDDARVAGLITLGSPHHGTVTARLGLGENTRQMQRQPGLDDAAAANPWLRALNAGETPRHRRLIVSLYSFHDNIVCPQTSSHLPGARNIPLHGIGHVDLCMHPAVCAKIIEELLAFSGKTDLMR